MTRIMLAIAMFCALASSAEARHYRHHRHPHATAWIAQGEPMTCDNDGRCKNGGGMPGFSSLLPFRSPRVDRAYRGMRGSSRGNVCTSQGRCATVASFAISEFRGLIVDLEHLGYAIGSPGCLSAGHMRNSKHHWGGACDLFNQVARNRTALRQPPPSVQIEVARRNGLVSGCIWHSPDCGHFEVSGR